MPSSRSESHPDNWAWSADPVEGGRGVIVDIDGVISDASHRQHYLDGARRDWRGFFGACDLDPPIDSLVRMIDLFDPGISVLLMTARPYYVQDKTLEWLGAHGVRWDLLVMRGRADEGVTSARFKRRAAKELIEVGFEIEVAIDDDIRNIEMFRSLGLPAVYIHSGYYE